jgi:hypothetical protein
MVMTAILESKMDFKMAAIIPWEMKNHRLCMHTSVEVLEVQHPS